MRDILETASHCLHKKNHAVWKQTRDVSDFHLFHFFLSLQTTLRFEISREDEVVKKLDLSFNLLIFVEAGTRYVG